MLCQFCADLNIDRCLYTAFRAGNNGLAHHASLADLISSAESGCELCALVIAQFVAACKPAEQDWASWKNYLVKGQEGRPTQETRIYCSHNKHMDLTYWSQPCLSGVSRRGQLLVRLSVYTDKDDPMSELIRARRIHSDVGAKDCQDLASMWLKSCSQKHPNCPVRKARGLPTRVLDVGSIDIHPRLFISDGHCGEWTTLSYCWGKPPYLTSTRDNFEAHQLEINLAQLPATIRDAVHITRNLGIRYLWVDALCIIQDDHSDWAREAGKMADIYKNAVATIIAEASCDSNIGIFNGTNQARRAIFPPAVPVPCFSAMHELKGYIHFIREIPSMLSPGLLGAVEGAAGPVSTRAWTLQEDLLSFRVLRFSGEQMRWRCHGEELTERFPLPGTSTDADRPWNRKESFAITRIEPKTLNEYGYPPSLEETAMHDWYSLISQFCERRISFTKDRIPAVEGLAREIKRQTGYSYIYGLWEEDIHNSLLWSTSIAGAIRPTDVRGKFPTWSWAGVDFSAEIPNAKAGFDGRKQPVYKDLQSITYNHMSSDETAEINIQDNLTPPILDILAPTLTICECHVPTAFLDCCASPAGRIEGKQCLEKDILAPDVLGLILNGRKEMVFQPFFFTSSIKSLQCQPGHLKLRYVKIRRFSITQYSASRTVIAALVLKHGGGDTYERTGLAFLIDDGAGGKWQQEQWQQEHLLVC